MRKEKCLCVRHLTLTFKLRSILQCPRTVSTISDSYSVTVPTASSLFNPNSAISAPGTGPRCPRQRRVLYREEAFSLGIVRQYQHYYRSYNRNIRLYLWHFFTWQLGALIYNLFFPLYLLSANITDKLRRRLQCGHVIFSPRSGLA